ncbi:MAG: hydroxymethylbilane synthase [Calditrichaeota bacterium]|nr:hydroxymethylbilane synthase [Calditrichota bacterium]
MLIGTRGSDLAKTQTGWIQEKIEKALNLTIEVKIISTQGDRVTDRPLRELEGSGYFTKELEEALLDHRIDIAVHSYKDMPSQTPAGLVVAAVSEREDVADLLIIRKDAACDDEDELFLKPEAIVGTSAVRREMQLKALRPDIETKDLRGNVPTRLRKLADGEYDAILLASAGVRRLGLDLSEFRVERLAPSLFVPAPGQGALAVQMRADDERVQQVRAAVYHGETFMATKIERQVQALFGGGCGLPLGAYACRKNSEWILEGFWFDGMQSPVRATVRGNLPDSLPQELFGELTQSSSSCSTGCC